MEGGREAGRESKEGRKRKKKKKGKNRAVFTRISRVRQQKPGLGKGLCHFCALQRQPRGFRKAETRDHRETWRLPGWGGRHSPCCPRKARELRPQSGVRPTILGLAPSSQAHRAHGSGRARSGKVSAHRREELTPSLCGSHQPRQRQPPLPSPGCGLQNSDPRSLPEPPCVKWRRDLPRELPRGCVVSSRIALDSRGHQEPDLAGSRQLLPIYESIF